MDRLGNQLGKTVDAFNLATGSVESRVIATARKLHELDFFEAEVPEIRRVDTVPRAVRLAEVDPMNGHANEAI